LALDTNKRVEDMNYFELLAWLGIGSSHPGGFLATQQNLALMQIKPDEYVLDAGCGSGLTACHLAKTVGCRVVGIDINPQFIDKARHRAEREGVSHLVEFQAADVYHLPFAANSFDVVLAESVTVFLDKGNVYREFWRVLKPQGRVADLEMALLQDLPPNVRTQLEQCYGTGTDPLPFDGWRNALAEAGFEEVEIKNQQPLQNRSNLLVNELKKDWLLVKDLATKASTQPGLLPRLQKNAGFIKQYQSFFAYGLVCGRKPIPQQISLPMRIKQILFRNLGHLSRHQ